MRWIAVAWFQRPLLAPWIHGQEDGKGLLLAPTFLLQALLGDPLPGVERASRPGDWLRSLVRSLFQSYPLAYSLGLPSAISEELPAGFVP